MINSLQLLFVRDLKKLTEELSQYQDESLLWKVEPGINNSAGNLALHIIGNLNHFIGAVLGNSGFIRNREAEFGDKNVPLSKIKSDIELTIKVVNKILANLSDDKLHENYPVEVFNYPMTIHYFLIHLYGHLNYHLGQVNYHRRLVL